MARVLRLNRSGASATVGLCHSVRSEPSTMHPKLTEIWGATVTCPEPVAEKLAPGVLRITPVCAPSTVTVPEALAETLPVTEVAAGFTVQLWDEALYV